MKGTVKGVRRRGRQKKRWEDNIREWTRLKFAKSQRAAENAGEIICGAPTTLAVKGLMMMMMMWCPNDPRGYGIDDDDDGKRYDNTCSPCSVSPLPGVVLCMGSLGQQNDDYTTQLPHQRDYRTVMGSDMTGLALFNKVRVWCLCTGLLAQQCHMKCKTASLQKV